MHVQHPPKRGDLVFRADVRDALSAGKPVVALESTILAHGLPYPENILTGNQLESAVRKSGAIPATIAVIGGCPHVGLTSEQLKLLCTSQDIRKLAVRDLPLAYASGFHGATTVSATAHIAHRAGISVFATGGIGGVHRRVTESWDISADIQALAQYPILVVSAGAKSILDIGKTLEALETVSVPVLVLRSTKFPAFYVRDSGYPAPSIVQSEHEVAAAFHAARSCGHSCGMLLSVPIPPEHEANSAVVSHAIDTALEELDRRPNVAPNEVTPFLLRRIVANSSGAALQANIHLAEHNARVAGEIAVILSKMGENVQTEKMNSQDNVNNGTNEADLVVIGAAVLDVICRAGNGQSGRSTAIGRTQVRAGGVGLNTALAAARFSGAKVRLVTAVGGDVASGVLRQLLQDMEKKESKLEVRVGQMEGRRGAVVSLMQNSEGDLMTGVADVDGVFGEESGGIYGVWGPEGIGREVESARLVLLDGNLSVNDLKGIVGTCRRMKKDVWFEPTSMEKCKRVIDARVLGEVRYVSPNVPEVLAMGASILGREMINEGGDDDEKMELAGRSILEMEGIDRRILIVTRGEKGVSVLWRRADGEFCRRDVGATAIDTVVSTTGAGDCLAGRCAGGVAAGEDFGVALSEGVRLAGWCCTIETNVPLYWHKQAASRL